MPDIDAATATSIPRRLQASAFFRGLAFASRHTPCAGRGASGIVIDNCLDGTHVTAHRSRSREGAMAARVDGEDAVGRAVASWSHGETSSVQATRRVRRRTRRLLARGSRPRLRSIRDGRCHAYCAAPGMPSAVLWSAWEALGPPPPPDHLAVPDVESADPNDSAGEQWRALLESSTLASCARCVRAYRAQVDRWDSAAETAQTEEEHDAAVLAALLRERGARAPKPSRRFGRGFARAKPSARKEPTLVLWMSRVVTRTPRYKTDPRGSTRRCTRRSRSCRGTPWNRPPRARALRKPRRISPSPRARAGRRGARDVRAKARTRTPPRCARKRKRNRRG